MPTDSTAVKYTDRQSADKQERRWAGRRRNTQIDRQTGKLIYGQPGSQIGTKTDRQDDRQPICLIYTQTDREADIQTHI